MDADRSMPPLADINDLDATRRIAVLQSQVEDLKHTLHIVLQCLVANSDVSHQDRYEALITDARAALAATERDYLD